MIIDGIETSKRIIGKLEEEFASCKGKKFLGALLVGDDSASLRFLKQKEKTARGLGIEFQLYQYPADITAEDLRGEIARLASSKKCGGFIVQLPLPKHIQRQRVLDAIPQEKDVDVLGEQSTAAFYAGQNKVMPPSVGTIEEILRGTNFNLKTSRVAVVGRGVLIGKPVAAWLEKKGARPFIFDSKTFRPSELKDADLVVSGAGRSGLFSAKHLKRGALVIDFGNEHKGGKVFGDFDSTGAEERNISYTKTPGGTGPILVAKLFENFYALSKE